MRLVKLMANYLFFSVVFLFVSIITYSQENSPFSRYGIGDLSPQANIASREMGGLSQTITSTQFINTVNPASYGTIGLVTYDFALTIDSRSLLNKTPVGKYKSINFAPQYLQLGLPLNKKGLGLVFSIRPSTRINYDVLDGMRISYDDLGVTDSLQELHEGNGGLNQVFFGLGKTWKNKKKPTTSFSFGFNAGYEWGSKFISNKVGFPSDSVYQAWYQSNSTDTTHFWGVFLNPGIMASFTLKETTDPLSKIKNSYVLVVGASGSFDRELNASRDITRETFFFKADGQAVPIDSVYRLADVRGQVNMPFSFNGGIMLNKMLANEYIKKWGIGIDYNFTPWSKYSDYGVPDQLNDSWFLRTGIEFSPNPLGNSGVFSTGIYRFGYYTGKDFQNADGNGYKVNAFTLGYQFNLRKYTSYD
ncbi:MAG: hypothetical protein ACHQF2_12085, partial [Flavobacteriales bacterium]